MQPARGVGLGLEDIMRKQLPRGSWEGTCKSRVLGASVCPEAAGTGEGSSRDSWEGIFHPREEPVEAAWVLEGQCGPREVLRVLAEKGLGDRLGYPVWEWRH